MANENQNIIGAGQDTAHRAPKINTITCGDCLEVMQGIPDKSVDMILCDLPYGTTVCKWDIVIPFARLWEQYKRVCDGAIILTASQPFTSKLICSNIQDFNYEIIWQKERPTNFMIGKKQVLKYHENICVFNSSIYNPILEEKPEENKRKNKPRKMTNLVYGIETGTKYEERTVLGGVKDWNYPHSIQFFSMERGKHPTQKPVTLFEYLVRTYTNEGDTVLDNCIGTGTTAIACINTGRNFIGIEKEEKYCQIAEERIHALRSPAQNTVEICHTAPNSGRDAMQVSLNV